MPDQSPLKPQGGFSSRYGSVPGGQSQSQYDKGSYLAEAGDINAVRARNQGFWDGLGNTGVNILSTVLGQATSAVGSLVDPVMEWMTGTEIAANQGITGAGLDVQTAGQQNNPIYYDPKKGFNADYLLSHIPSVASTLSMLLPGYGLAKGAGMAARAARLGSLASGIVATGVGSIGMRHAENWMESASLYEQMLKEGAQGLEPAFDQLTNEQIEHAARTAAATTYKANWSNLAFDMMQLAAILKPIKGLSGWTNTLGKESRFAQVMDYGYKTAVEKGFLADASKLTKFGLRSASFMRPLMLQATEGIEEAVNYVAEQEGRRDGLLDAGQPDDGTTFMDRLNGYLGKNELWDSFTWGLIGGVVFQKGGEVLNRAGAKAGWWEDTTGRGQMLADLKNRSDIVTRGYKDLSDPKLTEYDKETVKANMLFDLVSSNKSKESLDMLEEDLGNPEMVKHFAAMMGIKPEDAQKELPILLQDIQYINEKLDQYTGATLKSWSSSPTERISTGLNGIDEQTTTAAAVGPTRAARLANKVPFVHDPKVAMLLANNDYRVHVQDRLNRKAQQEMIGIMSNTFTGQENMDANAQAVFNLMAEVAALESVAKQENEDLTNRKSKKLPDSYIATADKRAKEAERTLAKKKAQLKQLQEVMDGNQKDGIAGTPFKDAQDFALLSLGQGGTASKYASLKNMYYLNQLDKAEQLEVNREVLTDPKKFMQDMITAFNADKVFRQMQTDQKAQDEAEQKQLDKDILALTSDTDAFYQKILKDNADALAEQLAQYNTPEEKTSYLNKELDAINAEIEAATNNNEFARGSAVEYANKYNKKLYQELKARQQAINDALRPYKQQKAAAPQAFSAQKPSASKKPGILRDQFEKGTPGHYYQGLVKMFGNDGNSGSFNSTFLNNETGVSGLTDIYNNYPPLIKGMQDVLDKFNKAKQVKDPNASDILLEANQYAQTGRDFNSIAPNARGDEAFQELQYLQEKYTRAETNMGMKPSTSLPWKGIAGGTYPQSYPTVYTFARDLIDTYPNLLILNDNISSIKGAIQQELQKAKDTHDQWITNQTKPAKPEGPVPDNKLDEAMDQTPESQQTIAEYPETETFTQSDNLYPATHAESVILLSEGDYKKIYGNGKAQPNAQLGTGNTIFIGKNNKIQKGFVQRGETVKFTFTGNFRGKNENAEKEIQITDMDGNHIGWLDTSMRLKKTIATLKNKQPRTEKKKNKIERTISKYNQLIPYYATVRSQFTNKGESITATVADQISQVEGGINSGGITIGSVITTQRDGNTNIPIGIHSAFGLDSVNRSYKDAVSPVLFGVYYNGEFSTRTPDGRFRDVAQVYPKVSIPTPARNVSTLSGKGTNNGAVFAVVPTNTFDQQGNRIHLPFKLNTATVTNVNLTSNGSVNGQTLPEAMLDILTQPDQRRQEFETLAGKVGIKFKKEFPITAKENRDQLINLFTTDNILSLFNSVTYVYDGKQESKSQLKSRDYSHHIGIDIFNPKAATEAGVTRPTIRFDLSNDTAVKNTFVVNLFDETGNFNPLFGKKQVTAAQNMTAEERAANPATQQLSQEVDVREAINKRFRQKLFRVDKEKLSSDSNGPKHKALVFENSRVVEKEYPSYLHFLDQHKILESTVHGVDFKAQDPKSNDIETGRTYFNDQSFWFDMNAKPAKKPAEPATANRDTTGQTTVKTPGDMLTDLRKAGGLKAYEGVALTPFNVTAIMEEIAQQAGNNYQGMITKGYPIELLSAALKAYPQDIKDKGYSEAEAELNAKIQEATTRLNKASIAKDQQAYVAILQEINVLGKQSETLKRTVDTVSLFKVPDAIRTSIGKRQDKLISQKGKGPNSYYEIDGERYERVSHILKGPGKEQGSPATAAGDLVDSFAKAAILQEIPDQDGFAEQSYNDLSAGMENIKKYLASKGQKVIGVDVVVYAKVKGGDGVVRNIAGEIDLLTIDKDNKMYIYDFKTSKLPFDLKSYVKNHPKTGSSRYDEHNQQLTAYSILLEKMVGDSVGGIGIIPITLDYTTEGKTVNIQSVVPYDVIMFEDFAYSSYQTFGDSGSTEIVPEGEDLGELNDDELDGMNFDEDPKDRPKLYMADSPQARAAANMPASPYTDPSRFRDHSRTYPEQKQYENYSSQMMLDVLYDHRVNSGNRSQLTYNEILERVRSEIEKKLIAYKKIIRAGGVYTKTKQISYTPGQIQDKQQQLNHLQQLSSLLEYNDMTPGMRNESQDFVGYGRMGIIKLSSMGIIRTDVIEEDVNVSGPQDLPYSVRFQENYAFKINPKTTINTEAKIFLSRIPEMDNSFRRKANLFGMNNYYNVDDVISELHIEFENIPPERFMDRLQELDNRIPIIRSTMQTISAVSSQSEDKGNQVRNQLSTLIKQRRDMKYLKADIDPDSGKVTARIIDAARQGISQSIIQTWEDNFRRNFRDLFEVEEVEDNNRSGIIKAVPKAVVLNYPEKGKGYDNATFELPTDFDKNVHKISWQTEWLYDRLKSIAAGNTPTLVNFTFAGDNLKVGNTTLAISKGDIAQLLLSVPSSNIILANNLKDIFKNEKFLKTTQLEQIGSNLSYWLKKPGVYSGNAELRKDKSGYYPIYYRIMADQLDAIGIQLSEDPETSWTVLQDLNEPLDITGQRRRFHMYDSRSDSFETFMNDKVNGLIIAPLLKSGAFNTVESKYISEDDGDFGEVARKIDVENPFSHSLQGINPLAKHSRLNWYSYANETIRNTNGDLEYTYTSANGLSTMLAKMKDESGSYLQQIAETPMGRHNLFIRSLQNSPTALEEFTMHYVDGGKVNNMIKLLPENANAGRANMLLWNLYYNNETRTAQRNKGGYMTTHSDSSIMPVMMFDKQVLQLDFIEAIDENNNRAYTLRLNELTPDGNENQVFRHLHGIFRGELQRMYEAFEAWKDIQAQPEDTRMKYALENYQLHFHFRIQNGKVVRGNATNMYLFGSTMFESNVSGIYQDDNKSGLRKAFFDTQGNANEAAIKSHFTDFINRYINELVDDAHQDVMRMGDSFFTIAEKKSQGLNAEDSKTSRLELKLNMINNDSVSAMRTLFNKNAGIITDEGRENVESRNVRIEKTYTDKGLAKSGMSEAEIKDFQAEAARTRQDDIKAATYPELQLRYMVADMALNQSIFLGSLFQTMLDPAIFEKGNNYRGFREDFEKRMKGPVSPGEVSYFGENESVKVVGFKDLTLGHIKAPIDRSQFAKHEQDFLREFAEKHNVTGDNFPSRIRDLMAVYLSRPADQKDSAWKDIASLLKSKVTDGGSYISAKEWLYRLYRGGQLTEQDYFDGVNYFKDKSGRRPKPAKVMKYVYGGNNITDTGSSSSNVYSYIKHAEIPLLPGIHTGTALDQIRQQIEAIEDREYAGITNEKPTPGIIAVPESSFKTGFPFNATIFNEDGGISDELGKEPVLNLNRGWLREQIQSPDDADKRTMISTQANVLTDLDIPASFRFGQRGDISFSNMQEEPQIELDDTGEEVTIEEPGTGISSNVLQNSVVQIFTELAERRFQDRIRTMGLQKDESQYVIDSVSRFISRIKEQAISRFGVGASAVDYLTVIDELDNGEVLSIPITFTPATKRMQSVFLAEIKDIFYRFTLPGGAFAQFSAAGLYETEKGKIKADSELKSYRVSVKTSRQYGSQEEATKRYHPSEIHTPYNPITKTLEYYEFEPGEAVIPWMFKDKNGKLLDYDTYVNADGTPKTNMIDSKLLDFVAFRIPNTGPNASARLRVFRFMRPEMGDGIAIAPEIVAILGADFDYDKLYSYIYNYDIDSNGRMTKIESVLHGSQNGTEDFFVSDNQKRQFARRELSLTNDRYRTLLDDQKAVQAGTIDLERDYNDMVGAMGKMDWQSFQELRNKVINLDPENLQKEIVLLEDEYMKSNEFDEAYRNASIYQRQSVPALENALIDRFNVMLGDFKMLQYMTSPLTSDWLSEQVNDKRIPFYEGADRKTASIIDQLHDKKFHSITSYNSFLQSRLSNVAAGDLIGMGANSLISQYQGQRWNLSLNAVAYSAEYQKAYLLRFKDRNGRIKQEEENTRDNSSYAGKYSPYTVRHRGDVLYTPPKDGRWRLDRITVTNDRGEKVNVSIALKAVLQAALDHQKNPLIDKAYINPTTFNAMNALIRLGYVDEAIPLLNQQSVFDYVQGISGYYDIQAQESRTTVMLRIVGEYASQYGINDDQLSALYRSLDPEHRNGAVLIDRVMENIPQVAEDNHILSTSDLLFGIAQRAGSAPLDSEYGIRQLAALRDYLIADIQGRQLFNIQQGTSAYAKGLKSNFAEVDLQERRFNSIFKYFPRTNRIESTAPLIAGLHRINYAWANALRRPFDFKPTMMSYGQFRGVRPTLQILNSAQGNVFTEFTPIFRGVRRAYFLTAIGTDVNKSLEGISNPEYTRVFNKINTNLVSFYFSNPELYRNLFSSNEEYDIFSQHGTELLTRPRKDLPYNPQFELFNTPESLAKTVDRISTKINPVTGNEYGIDYDILAAIKPIFNVSVKTPSSVVYITASGYQENLNHRLAMSIAEMYRSSDPELKSLAKKLLIYSYMTGGVTTPRSFVQFIPPSVLRDMGFDTVLRKTLEVSQRPQLINESIKSFMIQYFQHHPFELTKELDARTQLLYSDEGYVQHDKTLGRNVLQIHPNEKGWFKDKYIFRVSNRLFVHHPTDDNFLMQIDNLGMNTWHRNEYNFNFSRTPGNSLYLHNIAENSRLITEGIEVNGDFTSENVDENPEVNRLLKRLETPMFDKIYERPETVGAAIEAIQIDKTNPTAAGVLTFLKPVIQNAKLSFEQTANVIRGFHKPGTDIIVANPLYAGFKGLTTGVATEFNNSQFSELLAHEGTHLATATTIENVMLGREKDPAKVQAVKRLQELRQKTMNFMSRNDKLQERYSDLLKFMQITDKVIAGKKISAADTKFLKSNQPMAGFYTIDPGDRPEYVEVRQVQEFVAYAFSSDQFQKDLNNVDFRKGKSFWQELFQAIMKLLGLNITDEEAQAEITEIKKRLTPRQPIVNQAGVPDTRKNEISDTIRDMQPFSALHIAMREIIELGTIAKREGLSKSAFGEIAGKLNMTDMYQGVSNFNPAWSEEIKRIYHSATLNREIIC